MKESGTYTSHELLNLAESPFHSGFLIPGLIDNANEALVIGAISEVGDFAEQRNLHIILGVSRPAVTALTNIMIDKGLIEQGTNPNDRRSKILKLTSKGKKIASWMIERKKLLNKIQLKGFTEEEIRKYNELSTRMAENVLDISEREISRLPKFDDKEWDSKKEVRRFISDEDQELFITMAKKVRSVQKKSLKEN